MGRATDYDSVAAAYDVRYRNYDYSEIKEALTAFLGDAPLDAVLEVGCGTGFWLETLAGKARQIVGVDRSEGMLARAKEKGSALVRARAEQLPCRDASFDRVVCINALHHFDDRHQFFSECRRILRPGGGVFNVGLDPHAARDFWWIYDYFPETLEIDRQRYAAVRTIRAELVGAGFSRSESWEAQTFEHVMTARETFERGLVTRGFSSQLAVLSDEEFEAGVTRIRDGQARAEADGGDLTLVSELHLFATVGWVD